MPVSIVVGGQFGSEGKGKAVQYFARQLGVKAAVKVSGTNAGHTHVGLDGKTYVFRVLPAACTIPGVHAIISAGAYFQSDILLEECETAGFPMEHLHINPNAGIITPEIEAEEKGTDLRERIGSTKSGTGLATYHRVAKDGKFVAAKDIPELRPYICDTIALMRGWLNNDEHIIIEGAQGFGLSLYHTPEWPYCTSRDTTASAYIGDAGLSPFDVANVIQVLRTYPIRVAGNSGPLPREITWEEVSRRAGRTLLEYTSVTKKIRRVAEFDSGIVEQAVGVNRPNITVLNFLDYIPEDGVDLQAPYIGPNRLAFIRKVEASTGCKITHVGLDPDKIYPIDEVPRI